MSNIIPHNAELEEALAGCTLIDPEAYRQAQDIVVSGDFYIVKNGWVWEIVGDLVADGKPVDFVTVCDELEHRQQLDEIGGAAYVTQLINAVPSALHVREYAKRVADLADRRRTIQRATLLAKAAYNEDGQYPVEKAKIVASLSKDSVACNVTAIASAASGLYDVVEYNRANPLRPGEVRGLSTGLVDLDKLWGGLVVGLHLVAAVTNVGKTAFLLAIASNVARGGQRVMYVSPEMTAEQLVERIVCAEGRIDSDWIDSGRWPDDSYDRYVQLSGAIHEWPIDVLQTGSMREIRAQAYRLQPVLVVLDGIERLEGATREKTHERRGEIADQAAKMAIDEDILAPVLMSAQVGVKQVAQRKDKAPKLGDTYHTSEPDYIATSYSTLHRDDRWIVNVQTEQRNHEMIVDCWKHRTKKRKIPGRCILYYGDYGDISNLAREDVTLGWNQYK